MIIGVNGFKGSGKDTIGQYLVDQYGFTLKKFAAPLYASAAALLGVEPELLDATKNDENAIISLTHSQGDALQCPARMTVRTFLQRYGTESHRNIFGSNFWVDYLLNNLDVTDRVVITDARFENELIAIRQLGGRNVNVWRPGYNGGNHASEVEPPKELIHYRINNNGTIEQLHKTLDAMMAYYGIYNAYV